jgi:WD40 repeat protein/mono/diheme cytochrome c family protein
MIPFVGHARAVFLSFSLGSLVCLTAASNAAPEQAKVSYFHEVRPILQANCQGCHQPAKNKGGYVMTDFKKLLAGGDSEGAAVVASRPEKSSLVKMITPQDGEVRMPKGKTPLTDYDVNKIRDWIAQGAIDDTPADAVRHYDAEHPPVYTRLPVISSLDFSPDGKLLAVSGFHEVLLYEVRGNATPVLAGRLIGLSERVQSLRFSPDGKKLAVAGGDPARMGEVQIWDVANRKLVVSAPVSYDTLYGVSWSPDGKLIAFGCPDNTVRAIDASNGKQVVQMGSHSDWVMSTAFSLKSDHIISGGRDMSVKLTEVASQRFIDNVTSITPGALKGGILAVAQHPTLEHFVVGGSDGLPKVYRTFREVKREIGDDAQLIADLFPITGRVFTAQFSHDGKRIACAGGIDRVGEILVCSYNYTNDVPKELREIMGKVPGTRNQAQKDQLADYKKAGIHEIARVSVPQAEIYSLSFDASGNTIAAAGSDGFIRLYNATNGAVITEFPAVTLATNNAVAKAAKHIDYIRDVSPVVAHLGCNQGTCHGAKEGKNGFKLSLRGYDPETDLRAFTDDLASRRVNMASPDDSLMLLKAIAEVPHEGGRRMNRDSEFYKIIRQWIAEGAKLDMKSPRVTKIEIIPQNPVVQDIGAKQALQVKATYADGFVRDVTGLAFLDSGNTEVATIDTNAVITTVRRGEAPVLARFEGNYAATTVTVMGNRNGFVWKQPESWGKIDELVAAKWERMKIAPSELCTDLEFVRRIYLDLTGLPPTPEQVRSFVDDKREARTKRDELIDKLIGSPEFVDYWANKWADLLQCNSKFLGSEGAEIFRNWIRTQVDKNTPYDKFAREILTATGSNRENPAASYWKILRTPTEAMENTTQLFLATRFNCNKCHDHPFERWTQDQYYHLAAFFAQVSFAKDPKSGDKTIGGTAVEGAKPLFEIVSDAKEGEVKHDRTGKVSPPEFPYSAAMKVASAKPAQPAKDGKIIEPSGSTQKSRREQLADWVTSPDNRFFASSYANRMWGYLLGVGIIEPLDDIRAGNPPRNPALLEYLTHEFIDSGFNTRHLMQLICKSRTYQLAIRPNKWNEEDKVNWSHAIARRLPAETLFDSVFKVTGTMPDIPGAKPGVRAIQLSDAAIDSNGLLATLGRPARQSACECERSSDIRMGSVMALLSGPTISTAINQPTNALAKLVATEKDDRKLIEDVFMRVLNRPPSESEVTSTLALLSEVDKDRIAVTNELAKLEAKLAPSMKALNEQRDAAIAKAKTNLAVYSEMTATLAPELEKRHQNEIALTKRELTDYEKSIPLQAALLETRSNPAETKTVWTLVEPKKLAIGGKRKVKLTRTDDDAIISTGGKGPVDYIVNAMSPLTNITGVMIEVLPDDSLPEYGPGRAPNGNFVLTELELKFGLGTTAASTFAKFNGARADFSQQNFDVAQVIDGVTGGVNGWAISGAAGPMRHVAAFKLEKPIGDNKGVNLRFALKQQYDTEHIIGKFRIYVTSAADPLDLGFPEKVVKAARAPAGQRTAAQSAAVIEFVRNSDPELWKRKRALANVSAPLPEDAKLAELKGALKKAEQPIQLDPVLAQLREDAKASAEQSKNKRLTVVQDLTWALINSAGFLFNH